MNIFLTGSNGYIGNAFLLKAAKKGNKVFAVTRKKKNRKIKNVKWLIGPINKKWSELKKTDILVHLAAEGVYKKFASFKKCYEFNVIKSEEMIINAIKAGCKKWLIVSSKKEKKIRSLKLNNKIIKKHELKFNHIHALTKALFSKICIKYSAENNSKCRIIRLQHVYGGNEKKTRLWPSLIQAAKKNKNLYMTSGNQKTDFNYIDNVVNGLLDAIDFNKKTQIFPQIWDMGSGKIMSVKEFAIIIWKKLKPKSKIFFSKIKIYDKKNYTIKSKDLWKIKYTKPENTLKI